MPISAFSFYSKHTKVSLCYFSTTKTQYLCGFSLDYYNATPTKKKKDYHNLKVLLFYFSLSMFSFDVLIIALKKAVDIADGVS